jgi:hypothetical protein
MSVIELEDLSDSLAANASDDHALRPKGSLHSSSESLSGGTARARPSQTRPTVRTTPPKSSPSMTFRSTPTNMSPDPETAPRTPSSGRASPKASIIVHEKIISQAISRRHIEPIWSSSFDPKAQPRGTRFERESLQDRSLLEPYPYERIGTNLSEMFAHSGVFDDCMDLTGFGGHRDTFAVLGLRRRQARDIELPARFFKRLLRYIDFDTYLAIRLSCHSWSATLSQVRPPTLSPVYRLPAEILEQIYYNLLPVDFNAARHTCRAWMIASLDTRLLMRMLRRGGWIAAAKADGAILDSTPHMAITREWPLSKRLATECQLRSEWTGNGLACHSPELTSPKFSDRAKHPTRPALSLTTQINFSEFSLQSRRGSDTQLDAGRLFTPSVCGQYLLVTVDSRVFVYMLNKKASYLDHAGSQGIEAVTCVVCPREVLAVSMDTSCGRLALGALLEGRLGFVCELSPRSEIPLSVWRHPSNTRFDISGDDLDIEEPLPNESLAYHNRQGDMVPFAKYEMLFTNNPEQYSMYPSPIGIPVEEGPRSIYRNLCSAEDPPRSIAVCPHRRCVAFGCSDGVEIHWTDVLDGQGMSRWIPIANASDYLYFIPPRIDGDSVKRLRLTSSAAHPSVKASLGARFVTSELRETQQDEMVWECTSNLGFPDADPSPEPVKPDHYRTMPLSDGYHVLFIDPETCRVCLGCLPEAPAHDPRFVKRVILQGPSGDADQEIPIPICYTAAPDLSWGARIAVGYADGSLWLFSVPKDMFLASRCNGKDREMGWIEEYSASGHKDEAIHINEDGTGWLDWPMQIHGVYIADIEGLEDVTVDASNGTIALWAFSAGNLVRKYELSTGLDTQVQKSAVLQDGTIVPTQEDDGDWIMRNAPWIPSYVSTPVGYDGTTSAPGFQHPAWNLESRLPDLQRPGSSDEGYASDEGEPATSVGVESLGSLTGRLGRLRLSDSDVVMWDADADEGYVSARESRAESLMDVDIPTLTSWSLSDGVTAQSLPLGQDGQDEQGCDDEGVEHWASSSRAICIPSREKRWNGESFEEHDWTPDYGGTKGSEDGEGDGDGEIDLLDLALVEVEIL